MKYKLRKAVKEYLGPGEVVKDVQIRWVLLECGHSVRYQDPISTAEKVRQSYNYRRRCKQCAEEPKP